MATKRRSTKRSGSKTVKRKSTSKTTRSTRRPRRKSASKSKRSRSVSRSRSATRRRRSGSKRKPSAYNLFVKARINKLRRQNPNLAPTDYLSMAAKQWRQHKRDKGLTGGDGDYDYQYGGAKRRRTAKKSTTTKRKRKSSSGSKSARKTTRRKSTRKN